MFDFWRVLQLIGFFLTNGSERVIIQADVQFDLRQSAGKLIFDIQSGGSGVEV